MNKKKLLTGFCLTVIVAVLLVGASPQPTSAKSTFVLASWSFPDAYGQGISTWYAQTNHTGSWVTYESAGYLDSDPSPFAWNESQAMKILTWVSMNYTLTGASSLANGKNFIRQGIAIYDSSDDLAFSQQNFTYVQAIENDGLYWYQYYVIPDFLPVGGEVYSVELMYEVYY